jgi:hypothetical protein
MSQSSSNTAGDVMSRHESAAPGRAWLRRLGMLGFLFFLIKGLIWLSIPLMIAMGLWS